MYNIYGSFFVFFNQFLQLEVCMATSLFQNQSPEDRQIWWVSIPYWIAVLSAVVGWLFIFLGQHRMLYGPEAWGIYAQGNIVVLGNWLLLFGASLIFIYTVASLGQSVALWKHLLRLFVGAYTLFLANNCFARFEVWEIFEESLWSLNLILLAVLAFVCRLVYVKWYKYPADKPKLS